MNDYKVEEVLDALNALDFKSRKRVLVDQTSYLIAILAFKFAMSEHAIAKAVNCKRDKVHYNKKIALQFHADKSYKENIYVYSVMFPFELDIVEVARVHRSQRIELDLDPKLYKKLRAVKAILGHKDIRTTIKLFLEKSLILWEK
jgi:hypothetical protein